MKQLLTLNPEIFTATIGILRLEPPDFTDVVNLWEKPNSIESFLEIPHPPGPYLAVLHVGPDRHPDQFSLHQRWPRDWWQAFKEHWFPKFLLRWWPVHCNGYYLCWAACVPEKSNEAAP